jgi:Yeast PIR protein repeat
MPLLLAAVVVGLGIYHTNGLGPNNTAISRRDNYPSGCFLFRWGVHGICQGASESGEASPTSTFGTRIRSGTTPIQFSTTPPFSNSTSQITSPINGTTLVPKDSSKGDSGASLFTVIAISQISDGQPQAPTSI